MIRKIKANLNQIESVKKFVEISNNFQSEITVQSGRYIVDGKSFLGIMSLNLYEPVDVQIEGKNKLEIESFLNMMKQFKETENN